jgi:hypothetical protein
MYQIPEFDRNGFNPLTHNSFLRNRARILAKRNIDEEEEEIRILENERVTTFMLHFCLTNSNIFRQMMKLFLSPRGVSSVMFSCLYLSSLFYQLDLPFSSYLKTFNTSTSYFREFNKSVQQIKGCPK